MLRNGCRGEYPLRETHKEAIIIGPGESGWGGIGGGKTASCILKVLTIGYTELLELR